MKTQTKLLELNAAIKAVNDEPELPGEMPDEMWDAIRNDRDAATHAMREVVRLTKSGIIERMAAMPNAEVSHRRADVTK